jgi:hypothetical protein
MVDVQTSLVFHMKLIGQQEGNLRGALCEFELVSFASSLGLGSTTLLLPISAPTFFRIAALEGFSLLEDLAAKDKLQLE